MANGKIDKFMGKCNKQLQAVGSIKRKLTKTRSLSTSTDIVSGYDDPDLDHLLENTDQDPDHSTLNGKQRRRKSKRQKNVTIERSNFRASDENLSNKKNKKDKVVEGEKASSCGNSPNKYQLPSSMIVLSKQEEAELRDVIMQMTLRDCGL